MSLKLSVVILIIYCGFVQSQKFCTTDQLWWQGLARIMEGKGYIREGDEKVLAQMIFHSHSSVFEVLGYTKYLQCISVSALLCMCKN